ncbi:fibronectin type III domain-containing protein-like, partial [Stylophora pistillata]|uniref:fibronectin type III domain-containing protein-like n=1 Tax=Stylophora pistillata TaxID=50429 RepID=UPI000C049C30
IFYWGAILSAKTRRRRRAIPSYANSTDVKGRTTSSTAVSDLKPYSSYTVAIKAFNSGGKGPAIPGPPSDVKVYPFALYILVTWKPPVEPNGIIKNYQAGSAKFKGSEPKDTPVEMTELETSKRRYLIGKEVKQEELTNYVVEIQAKTEPGYGASVRIPTKTVKVSAPAKPKTPTVEPTAIDKVRITYIFGIGGGYTHEFLVQYRLKLENEEFVNSSWVNYLNDEFDLEIGGLESALYQFRIIARNDQGESPPSEITEARPMPGILGK